MTQYIYKSRVFVYSRQSNNIVDIMGEGKEEDEKEAESEEVRIKS